MAGKDNRSPDRELVVLTLRQSEGGTTADPWRGFSLKKEVRLLEERFIRLALEEAGGKVTGAAKLLGLHYQTLVLLLDQRHRALLPLRKPAVRRRRVVRPSAAHTPAGGRTTKAEGPSVILHADGDEVSAREVRGVLEAEGWVVDGCRLGTEALRKLVGPGRYDLLLFAGELAGVGGAELARRARELPHRRRTPVVIMGGDEMEREAWGAGADAFLRRHEETRRVVSTVRRLLGRKRPPVKR
jgi:CheY-like chemotaxis protein